MIRTSTCIVCGTRRLERAGGGIAPFIAHRCRIDPATGIDRVWCPRCDLLFFDQRLDEMEVRRLYAGYRDEAYVLERTRFEPAYTGRHIQCVDIRNEVQQSRILGLKMEFAAQNRPLGRVLDFGGGDGWLTRNAFPDGDIEVFDLADGGAVPPRGSFDLVVCAHVLEHVSFPVPLVRELMRFMRPGGLVYIEVPGPGQRPPGTSVFEYMGPLMHEHVSFFSGRAVVRLLHRCGLRPVQTFAVKEVTKVFARRAGLSVQPLLEERFRPGRLPPPTRGPQGTDTCG
jgi:SAM-dependent methyltransferase